MLDIVHRTKNRNLNQPQTRVVKDDPSGSRTSVPPVTRMKRQGHQKRTLSDEASAHLLAEDLYTGPGFGSQIEATDLRLLRNQSLGFGLFLLVPAALLFLLPLSVEGMGLSFYMSGVMGLGLVLWSIVHLREARKYGQTAREMTRAPRLRYHSRRPSFA